MDGVPGAQARERRASWVWVKAAADHRAQQACLDAQPPQVPQGLSPRSSPAQAAGASKRGGAHQWDECVDGDAQRGASLIAEHREYLARTAAELQRLAERLAATQGALAV